MPRPLLPLIEGGQEWDALNKKPGLNPEQKKDFPDRLYKYGTIEASGVPSLFNHPFGVYTKLNAGVGETFKNFSTLIKGIFLGVISLENITDNLGQLMEVAKRVKPDFNNFVVLKWKEKPIGGVYPDCLVFSGAKFEAGEYEKDISLDGLQDEIQKKENQLGSGIVRALFTKWTDEIASILKLPAGVDGPLWFQMLSRMSTEWASQIQPPPTALDDFTTVLSNVQLTLNNNLVKIPVRAISKNIFCEKIIKFVSGKMPDLPVKSEFLNLVNTVNKAGDMYQLTLTGWAGTINWTPQEIVDGDKASILLWPDFKATGWNINYAFFYPSPILRGKSPSLSLINFDGKTPSCSTKIKEEERVMAGCAVNKEVTHIEIFCNEKPVGVFLDGRESISGGTGEWKVSLDFGTSHTCLSIIDGEKILPFNFRDFTFDILEMKLYNQSAFDVNPYWLPTFKGDFTVLPSEMLFINDERLRDVDSLNEPIKYFTIPSFQNPIGIGESSTVSEFKWHEPQILRGHRKKLVKAYLKIVMHMALADLKKNKNATSIDVAPTYPLAFDKNRRDDYNTWLGELFAELKEETGTQQIQLAISALDDNGNYRRELIGESYAGSAAFKPAEDIVELVVDIGGGTTDIALFKEKKPLVVDSFRYGGNIFLRKLARDFYNNLSNDDDIEIRKMIIQKTIRRDGIKKIFDRYQDKTQRAQVEQSLLKFFDGLFEYLRCLLNAFELKKGIFFYPIGNGWRLIEGFTSVNNTNTFIKEWFSRKRVGIDLTIQPIEKGGKESLAIGANEIVNGALIKPPEDEPVKSIVGGDIEIKWRGGKRIFSSIDPIPTRGIDCRLTDNPTFNTTIFIRALPFELPEELTADQVAGWLNQKCGDKDANMLVQGSGGVSLIRSVFARFLETIYPKHYLGKGD